MERRNGIKAGIFLFILILLCACSKKAPVGSDRLAASTDDGSAEETNPKAVTVMVYMVGSNLESSSAAATGDLEEMQKSGLDPDQVNLLVFTGGCEAWHSEVDIPNDKNALLILTEQGFEKIGEYELLSMGDPDNLSDFLSFSWNHYPAEEFDLILWDHGNGPVMGYGSDMLFDGDSMTLLELKTALENSPFVDDNKLGIIGFDACLMSSMELAEVTADHAEYLVASQEAEPSFGWDYSFLSDCGKVSQRDLAVSIVDHYITYSEDYFAEKPFLQSDVTLSVTDLSYVKEVGEKLNTLFEKASGDVSGDYNQLAKARISSRSFGRSSTGSEYDLVDLLTLMQKMSEKYPEEASSVEKALENAVVKSGSNAADCCGISLYYPYYNKNYYENAWRDAYLALNSFPGYSSYLERYDQIWFGTDRKELFNGEMIPVENKEALRISLQLSEEQKDAYAKGMYVILRRVGDELYDVLNCSDLVAYSDGRLTADYDGKILYYKNDHGLSGIPVCRITDSDEEAIYYSIGGYVARGIISDEEYELRTVEYQIELDKQTQEVLVKGFYFKDSDADSLETGKREPVDLNEWDVYGFANLRPCYLTRDDNGRISDYLDWDERGVYRATESSVKDGLSFVYEPLYNDGSSYFMAFRIMDTQGNMHMSELIPLDPEEMPEQEDRTEEVFRFPENDNQLLLVEESGVSLEILLYKDINEVKQIGFRVENHGTEAVNVSMDHITYDATILSTFTCSWHELQPGETSVRILDDLDDVYYIEDIDHLERVDFTISIWESDTQKTLLEKEKCRVLFSENQSFAPYILPFMDAQAEEQLLLEEEGVRVSLLGLGRYLDRHGYSPDYDESVLDALIEIENVSDLPVEICVGSIEVNQAAVSTGDGGISVLPGARYYKRLTIDGRDVSEMDPGDFLFFSAGEETEEISSISEVSVLITVRGITYRCPVVLDKKGDGEKVSPSGEAIYENDEVSLILRDHRWSENDENRHLWYMWILNRTDRPLSLIMEPEGDSDGSIVKTDGRASNFISFGWNMDEGMDGVEMRISKMDENGDLIDLGTVKLPEK